VYDVETKSLMHMSSPHSLSRMSSYKSSALISKAFNRDSQLPGNYGLHLTWILKTEALFSGQKDTESLSGRIVSGWRLRFASYWESLLNEENTCQLLLSLNAWCSISNCVH
jgi:hypothetical protein